MTSWDSNVPVVRTPITLAGWFRIVARAVPTIMLVFGGLIVLLAIRLVERPLCGLHRPVTPRITQFVCRNALRLLGIGYVVVGTPMTTGGAVVANHTSWLDILVLNAAKRIYFVSKSEVASWPAIGWLARATGTVFIERNPSRARQHTALFQARLLAGHRLLFFPEGTSTDGLQVLPFKTTLFQAFFAPELHDTLSVQPVTIVYHAPSDRDPRFYGWWGEMSFGAHLFTTLAPVKQGRVEVIYHPALAVSEFADRKALARACQESVHGGHPSAARQTPAVVT
jgi:1-acyl-sn-glycerol-3-phosphate acyltransferase